MTAQDVRSPDTQDAGLAERAKLRRELSRLDTIFFLISAMVVVDTIGAIAIGGGEAFTWLVVLFVFFFIPSALASAELGAAIPDEGGAYVWVRMAFGRFAGALTSLLYWAGTPMWLGGSVAVVAMSVYGRFFGELSQPALYGFGTVFIGLATLGAVVPVLLYSFVGVELPSTAGEEMRNPRRDIPVAIARAGVGQALMYGIPILAVLVVLPAEQVTSLGGLIDAMKTVFTVHGGSVAADGSVVLSGGGQLLGWASALVFIWVLMASGAAWIMGAGRAQAAACMDGAGPRALGRISPRTGVPVVMGLVSGAVSLGAMAASLWITRGDGQKYFSAALTVSIALIVLAYLLIYPAFLALRLRRPDLERPFLAPGGRAVAWLITILATGWSLLVTACLLWPGLGTADPDAALPAGFEGQRLQFELLVLAPLAAVVAACTVFHLASRRPS
jgi:amino acid transporter